MTVTDREPLTIAEALFGKTRRSVLALLYGHSDRSYYLREIERLTSAGVGPLQRELALLTRAGLVKRERVGNQVHYRANRSSPVYVELRGLVAKTVGVAGVLQEALASVAEKIEVALIYGSVARGEETAASDVDVLIVGSITFAEAVAVLHPSESALGREVNPTVFTPEEFGARARDAHPFVQTLLAGAKTMLVGDEDDLRHLAT
jgi:uncharacterized protein